MDDDERLDEVERSQVREIVTPQVKPLASRRNPSSIVIRRLVLSLTVGDRRNSSCVACRRKTERPSPRTQPVPSLEPAPAARALVELHDLRDPTGSLTLPDRLSCSLGFTKDQLVPMGSQIARVRERANSGAEAEVRAKASWRMSRSDCGEP
ncbi:hypothetical protein E6C27_scaffold21G003750 [Cucumis melo var. makuwa]|uniref:Uncharacterized protein n=1 Tax=Cucumis melo var. makuwa TaxID=1194695 RepID=A0A5A7VIZ1_CUCMM|nr:hypothetical protein E6C27_scaffold21G003750 [Cucumis melo var. makuwa]